MLSACIYADPFHSDYADLSTALVSEIAELRAALYQTRQLLAQHQAALAAAEDEIDLLRCKLGVAEGVPA